MITENNRIKIILIIAEGSNQTEYFNTYVEKVNKLLITFEKYKISYKVIISGGLKGKSGLSEAKAFADKLKNIDANSLIIEERSITLTQKIINSTTIIKKLINKFGLDKLIIYCNKLNKARLELLGVFFLRFCSDVRYRSVEYDSDLKTIFVRSIRITEKIFNHTIENLFKLFKNSEK